jgi:hypothetical protein
MRYVAAITFLILFSVAVDQLYAYLAKHWNG